MKLVVTSRTSTDRASVSVLLAVVVLFCLTSLSHCDSKFDLNKSITKCNKTEADQIVRWLFFFNDPERILPDNSKAFEEFCNERNQKELYVKEYARRCLAKFPRQVTTLLMFGIIRKNRHFCAFTKARNEFIHGAHCLNLIKSKGSKCLTKAIHDFLAIKNTPVNGRVGKTCCIYYQLEDCLIHEVHEQHEGCSSRDAQLIEDLLQGYTGQVLSNVCSHYPKNNDNCSKLLPKKDMIKLRKNVANQVNQTYSILPPLIEILDSIPP